MYTQYIKKDLYKIVNSTFKHELCTYTCTNNNFHNFLIFKLSLLEFLFWHLSFCREMGGLLIIIAWTSIARFTTVGRYQLIWQWSFVSLILNAFSKTKDYAFKTFYDHRITVFHEYLCFAGDPWKIFHLKKKNLT